MIPIQYGYTIGLVLPTALWFVLYVGRPDLRKELLALSWRLAFASAATAYLFWTIDWWHPGTLTGTRVGIEDFVLGFAAGSLAIFYEIIYAKRHARIPRTQRHQRLDPHLIMLLVFLSIGFLTYGFGLTSFVSTISTLTVATAVIWYYRPDLIRDSIAGGIWTTIFSLAGYVPILMFVPGWVDATYDFRYLSGNLVGGIPIEEFVFWFFAGMFFGPVWEYWKYERVRKTAVR